MVNVITELSKYAMVLFLALYTSLGFSLVRKPEDEKRAALWQQNFLLFGMLLMGNLILYLNTDNEKIIGFCGAQVVLFVVFLTLQHLIYPKSDRLLNHNLLVLLSVGFLMLARLSFDKATRQFELAVLAAGLTFLIPWLIRKSAGKLRKLYWGYGALGFGLLTAVLIAGKLSFGAKLAITIHGITFQPSEFVKVLFVFFVAGMFYERQDFKRVVIATAAAAAHVLVLVFSRDLGSALIFFVTYLVMLYIATRQPLYFLAGLLSGSGAAYLASKLFSHVQTRVLAWSDPFSVIEKEGYQITQSLFAIGTGSWFGLGLGQGMPYKIPVVEEDFIFAAIAEECGILFAVFLIFVYMCSFYMILNIAMCLKDSYYKLVAAGLGTFVMFQAFLSIGGVIKFIPSTGVTLPFISYGGSSLVSMFAIWAIVQGMYLKRSDEVAENERGKDKEAKKKNRKKQERRPGSREYNNIMLIFTGIFVVMIGYLVYFQVAESRETINNPYNARLETFENRVIRGSILASDGQLLAYTKVEDDGSETRVYPFGCTFSHVLGYSEYGKTGIEELGNFQLLNSNAYFAEKFINELKEQKNIGDSLVTTLDVKLQTAAHDALGNQKGAVVVIEASTGNVRALVSKPDYDPGEVAMKWAELSSSEDSMLLNRALQGLYPPGSTFKTITLLEYLREHPYDSANYSFVCEGKVSVGNSSISCYHGTRHGELDLKRAYAKSCNSAFADMGRSLDVHSFKNLANQLLFNTELPIAFPYQKSSFSLKTSDLEALHMMTAIGQGETLVTPMHMAMIMSAIANDGILMTPRFLERTESYTGQTVVERYPVTEYGSLLDAGEAQTLQEYLRAVVEEGTASALLSDAYTAAGKTGTAEYSSDKNKSHAWFTGYVTGEKPDLAVCVLVEGAGSGSEYAVPVAKGFLMRIMSETIESTLRGLSIVMN